MILIIFATYPFRLNFTKKHTISLSGFGCSLVFIAFMLIQSGCNPTRYVPSGNYLLDKNKIEINNKNVSVKDLQGYVRQKPNKRILGMRFHLFLYDLSNINKTRWPHAWLRRIGEEPVILDTSQVLRSVEQFDLFLRNKGYYYAKVKDTLLYHKRRAEAVYQIHTGQPYIIRKISYLIHDTALTSLVMKDTVNSLIHPGILFDADVLQDERLRLETLMKSNGYYSFVKEYIFFFADTTLGNFGVSLQVEIRNYVGPLDGNPSVEQPHPRYRIKDIFVNTDYDPQANATKQIPEGKTFQTSIYDSIHFIYTGKFYIKPKIINEAIYIQRGKYYNINDVDKSYLHLSGLRTYKFVDIQFDSVDNSKVHSADRWLNCIIRLSPMNKQAFSVSVEGTNSSGIFGVAGNMSYSHKNFFRGAEIMDISLKGGIEGGKESYLKQIGSILELGATGNLRIPKFWLPFHTEQFIKKFGPKTNISVAYNFQRRPDYTRTIANTSFGYTWKGNKYLTHTVNPIELNAVKLFAITDTFKSLINENPYLAYAYQDHFVSVASYTLVYNNQKLTKFSDYMFFRFNFESAGNFLRGMNNLLHTTQTNGTYRLFGLEYSQFLRSEFDIRYFKVLNKTDRVVFRFFAGAGVPYGNSKAIPFEKQYFSGGFNSIRAWAPRELGPGSYRTNQSAQFPNSTGDMKLEANVEYRFKLFWILEGALFTDAGNIWAITRNDDRPGALFQWNSFLNDIAVGTGFGLRFDFSFFIFATDFGFKTRDPSVTGSKWFPNEGKWTNSFTINLGIGYPF